METAKLFMNGGSQAVRLPKSCRFEGDEVYVMKMGGAVMLVPKDDPWLGMMEAIEMMPDDFMEDGIEELPYEKRDW